MTFVINDRPSSLLEALTASSGGLPLLLAAFLALTAGLGYAILRARGRASRGLG